MHFVFSCFKIWLLINSKHITSQSWFKIERNVICCRSMGPLMSMVTCSVTSVTTTASSVLLPLHFRIFMYCSVVKLCAIFLVVYCNSIELLYSSGICCHLQPLWVLPCQSWQWTRSWGLLPPRRAHHDRMWYIFLNNFSRILSWWMEQIWICSLRELLTINLTTLPKTLSLHVMR